MCFPLFLRASGPKNSKSKIFLSRFSPDVLPSTSSTQLPQYKAIVKLNTSLDTAQGGDLVDMHQFNTGNYVMGAHYCTVVDAISFPEFPLHNPRTGILWKRDCS